MKQRLLLLFLLAFFMFLPALNQSLWLDEATTARVLQQFNFSQIISQFSLHDFHPPLYYLLMKLWTNIFGYSEIALRIPSVLFWLGTGWMIFLIGKKLKNKAVGFWGAALFLLNPLIVYYAQEARMYMMVTFLITAAIYYLVKVLDTQFFDDNERARSAAHLSSHKKLVSSHLFLFNLFIFLAFLTFYGSVFFIAAVYLYLLIKKEFRMLLLLLPGFFVALMLVSPLLYQQYLNSQEQLALVANWRNVLGTVNIKNLLLIPLKFSIGRISWAPKTLYYALSGLWTIFVFWFIAKKFNSGFFFLFVIPLVLGLFFSFFSPLLQYFRFLYLIPLMALLLVLGADKKWQRLTLLVGFVVFSAIYLFNPTFHREDWKSLTGSLKNASKVYMIPSSADPLKYYKPEIKIADLRNKNKERQIVVIPYTADIHGVDYKMRLAAEGYSQVKVRTFRGLSYEVWFRKTP